MKRGVVALKMKRTVLFNEEVTLTRKTHRGEKMTLQDENEELKKALRGAIISTKRTERVTIEHDPGAGSTYGYSWLPHVEKWAKLCGLDLDTLNPSFYER